jgi:hypothetical protein
VNDTLDELGAYGGGGFKEPRRFGVSRSTYF